jgi:hypothetical protein
MERSIQHKTYRSFTMKKNLILAAILSTITFSAQANPLNAISAATGSTRDDSFDYAGFSMGINSHTTPTTNSGGEVNGTLTWGEGLRLTDAQALAGELQLVSLNGHMIPAAQAVYYTSGSDMDIDHVPVLLALHSGVGTRMGLTAGVDLVFPIAVMPTSSIRTGFTLFQNKVDGAHGMFQAGLYTSF